MSHEQRPSQSPDQIAAHQLLCELGSSVITQRVPYQYGVESSTLEGLHEIFEQVREILKSNPGCSEVTSLANNMLNRTLRPVTAKWHRAPKEGLLASRDGADAFRGDLQRLREEVLPLMQRLREIAYGAVSSEDRDLPPAIQGAEIDRCFEPLDFGIRILTDPKLADKQRLIPEINKSERNAIQSRRRKACGELSGPSSRDLSAAASAPCADVVGLALSGGGIRSATFCLGVVQVLASRGLLEDIDMLSTVSGGGYTGSFITTTICNGPSSSLLGQPYGPDPQPIARIRANAKYLTSASPWEAWMRVTATVTGMLLNWSVPLSVVTLGALAAIYLQVNQHCLVAWWPRVIAICCALTALTVVAYGCSMRRGKEVCRRYGIAVAVAFAFTLGAVVLWGLGRGYRLIGHLESTKAVILSLGSTLLTMGPAVLRFVPMFRNRKARTIGVNVALFLAAFSAPLIVLIAFYAAWYIGDPTTVQFPWLNELAGENGKRILIAAIALLCLVTVFVIDVNQTGPHRLYRNALARTFIGADLRLDKISPDDSAPYHLVNATVNLPSSSDSSLRDRRGDFFMFSKYWCGSMATGYKPTTEWITQGGVPDLKTAMAISGAAVSSHMGLQSRPALSAMITLLNLRLGFWIENPPQRAHSRKPGFACLLKEMLGCGMTEKAVWLNLSDGGHVENTGCYELFRRRCKFVVAVDGEADPTVTFGGLMTLVRHLQVNLGIRIDPCLDGLRPQAGSGLCQQHAMLCRVYYPQTPEDLKPQVGLLLYMKLSLTGNESELVRRYKFLHPEFPHESTLDQFFDEEQFEVYRQLGVHTCEGMFGEALLGGASNPRTIREWFRPLASSLLESSYLERSRPVCR